MGIEMQLLKKEPLIKEMQLQKKRSVFSLKMDCYKLLAILNKVKRFI